MRLRFVGVIGACAIEAANMKLTVRKMRIDFTDILKSALSINPVSIRLATVGRLRPQSTGFLDSPR